MRDHLTIGRTIARLRNKHGLSQEALARDLQLAGLDLSRDMIMNIERGRTGLSLTVLCQIAAVLGEEVIEFHPGNFRPSPFVSSWLEYPVTVIVHHDRRTGRNKTPGTSSGHGPKAH